MYLNNQTGKYSAQVGMKNAQVGTCTTPSMTFSTPYLTGDAITAATGGSSCSATALGTDHQKQFVIKTAGTDPVTNNNLSYLPPAPGFTSSIRIGNGCGGTQANVLCYDFEVKPNNALVYIWFAISLENTLHDAAYNPEFNIRVKKMNLQTNQYENISDTMCYIVQSPTSSNNLGVFQLGGSAGEGNIYRPWEQVVINLYDLLYQYVRIEIMTGDCGYSAHYGYGYVAGKCAPMALQATGCAAGTSDTVATIDAPSGLSSYQWYAYSEGTGTTASTSVSDYVLMPGRTDSILRLLTSDFILPDGTEVSQRSFLCQMTSYMNPALPITSVLKTEVGSMKPMLIVDSIYSCDGNVYLKDISTVAFTAGNDSNQVDTTYTQWKIYSSLDTNRANLLDSVRGPSMTYTFDEPGEHTILVRTHSYKHEECWNEKMVRVKSLATPTPQMTFDQTVYCIGDTVTIMDMTTNPALEAQFSSWREFVVHKANGRRDTIVQPGNLPGARRLTFICDTTITRVQMKVRTDQVTYRDTNADGVVEPIYCFAYIDTIVPAERYPELTVMGDTIVCYGNTSEVSVANANSETTNFAWYMSLYGSNPLGTNANFSEPNVTTDKTYFVKATTQGAECTTWDSISISLVVPKLVVPDNQMCTDEFVYLYGEGASSYTWTAMPDDPTLNPQGNGDTIRVSPRKNTTYTLVGHGTNGCSANPLTAYIEVFPYPVPTVTLDPAFIDSENPVVTFTDVSPHSTTSLWDFGNGNTSTARSVSQRFTDISQDSVLVSLTSGNALGCTSDTSFYVPIDLFAVWFPNVFTPTLNSNRTFRVYTHNELQYFSLYIYDRRGQLVFHSTDQTKAWDGKHNGKLCDQGAYVYVCNYRRGGLNELTTLKGTVLLLQ